MKAKLTYKNGFTLFGEVIERTEAGVWFKTTQQTSFINYDLIECIKEIGG